MKIGVFIPSMGRADRVRTVPWIPKGYRADTYLVVPPSEVDDYCKHNTTRLLECGKKGIGPTRDWIMRWARDQRYTHVIMMDDDLSFFTRRTDDPTKFLSATREDMQVCFNNLRDLLREYAHASILPKQGSNRVTDPVVMNTRLLRVLAYDVKVFHSLKLRFADMEFMEDFHVTLQLLRAGYQNATVGTHAQDQFGSQTTGGCSIYRTLEGQAASAIELQKRHPNFVKVVQKETKGAWGGGVRTDVMIMWKKALASAKKVGV